MFNDLPFEYGLVNWFNSNFHDFQRMETLYNSDNLDNNGKEVFFNKIIEIIHLYWRFVKRTYKERKGIKLTTPREGFLKAQSDGMIHDADTWVEFIDDMNVCMATTNPEESLEIRDKMLEYYHTKLYSTLDYVHCEEHSKIMQEYAEQARYQQSLQLEFDMSKPVYNCDEIGISERSYNILLDYFRSKKEIKNVWLHGSRAHGNATGSSDLDLIVDCDNAFLQQISDEIGALKIPYICDPAGYYNERNIKYFYKLIKPFITKRIYRAEDFNIHWEEKSLANKLPVFNISKIVTDSLENNETLCQIGPYWQDYYRNEFDNIYLWISEQIKTGNRIKNFNNRFINLFDTTLRQMCLYLSNNGFYPNNDKEIVRYAYKSGLLANPDEWIIAEDLLYKFKNSLVGLEELVNYCADEHFYIFDNIHEHFKSLMEQDGKITD